VHSILVDLFSCALEFIINPITDYLISFASEHTRSVFLSILPFTLIYAKVCISSFAISMWFVVKNITSIDTAILKGKLVQPTLEYIATISIRLLFLNYFFVSILGTILPTYCLRNCISVVRSFFNISLHARLI
jgi:hypothetical protein